MYIFTTQYTFNSDLSDKHAHSDEIITIPDESFTIPELLKRAKANTLPHLSDYSKEYDDDDISFDDELLFYKATDLTELADMQESISRRIAQLTEEAKSHNSIKTAKPEPPKENLAQHKNDEELTT